MKSFPCLALIVFFYSCNSGKLHEKYVFNNESMKSLTAVASIGLFEKIHYKFIEAEKDTKSHIALSLYNSHLGIDKMDEQEMALHTAKAFQQKFADSKKYDSLFVKIIVTEKDNLSSIIKETSYHFATSGL